MDLALNFADAAFMTQSWKTYRKQLYMVIHIEMEAHLDGFWLL